MIAGSTLAAPGNAVRRPHSAVSAHEVVASAQGTGGNMCLHMGDADMANNLEPIREFSR